MNEKFVTKPAFQELKANTDGELNHTKRRVEELEKETRRLAERSAQGLQAQQKENEAVNAKISKMLRDIRDLYAVGGSSGTPIPRSTAATSSEDLEDLKQLIDELQNQIERKQSIDDANNQFDELEDKLKRIKVGMSGGNNDITEAEKCKWDQNCVKTTEL